jgi:FkbM family methyltransferase
MTNPVLSIAGWAARVLPERAKRSLYRLGPLSGLIRKGLNRAAPEGFVQVRVAGGDLSGFELYLDLQREKDYWLGTYEPELQAAIQDLVEEGEAAYDVGANIGYISLLLARKLGPAGKVYAFEALPANLERLEANLKANRLVSQVEVLPVAVVDRRRPVKFLLGPSGGTGKAEDSEGRKELDYQASIQVKGVSLDEFVYQDGNQAPRIIKMDIEGGEVLALPGMKRVLKDVRPLVFLELHGPEAVDAAWQVFKEADYRICRMQPGYPEIISQENLDWKAYVVAFPHER